MRVSNELTVFEFEKDFAGSLRCIPMVVRFKLDHAGIKLSLRQWSRFSHADRALLLSLPCSSDDELRHYRSTLIELIEVSAKEPARPFVVEVDPQWAKSDQVAVRVIEHAHTLGVVPPTVKQWAAMTPLQRFALLKLTREGHDNANFIPAMREFGVFPT